jgi:bifunctional N-acetylglucosamine-1-phosphate-uridyltransferase/glucosamine-1-phosphate-acetyltransferase GlmU-like protein
MYCHERIIDRDIVPRYYPMPSSPAKWTAIIPAAGRGTRLQWTGAKALYPILGKPILEWIILEIVDLCESFVFVLSPDTCEAIIPLLDRLLVDRYRVVNQSLATGTADAVAIALPNVTTESVLVAWGDHVGLTRSTVAAAMRAHEHRCDAILTFPTAMRPEPYIAFQRAPDCRLMGLRQARERDAMPPLGESDCGIFLFRASALSATLARSPKKEYVGRETKETSLLHFLPMFESFGDGAVLTIRTPDASETCGVNTVAEANLCEATLITRQQTAKFHHG